MAPGHLSYEFYQGKSAYQRDIKNSLGHGNAFQILDDRYKRFGQVIRLLDTYFSRERYCQCRAVVTFN